MGKRSKAGGGPKRRPRNKPEPKRRAAPNTKARSRSPARADATKLARLARELKDARDQQTAMSDVLHAISRSRFELSAVLESVAEAAARLCRADGAVIFQLDGGVYRFAAGYSLVPAYLEIERQSVISPGRGTVVGRAAMTRQVIRIDDLLSEPLYEQKEESKVEGNRSMIGVPLLRDGEPVVVIGLGRRRIDPFGDREIELATTFAAQAMIAIENARLLNELRQSLERQTATSAVLEVISSFPGNLEPVFATMLGKAVSICDAKFGTLYFREGDKLRLITAHDVPPAFAKAQGKAPFHPAPDGMLDAVMRTGRTVHLADLAQVRSYIERDPRTVEAVEVGGIRSVLGVPLAKEHELIGIIGIYRQEVRPFADEQIEVLTNFAAQAMIAIENARLLGELRQRTTDLTEALEQQTATSDVLRVVSSSPGDLQPVFASMLENAVRICDANFGNIYTWDGDALHLVATHKTPVAFAQERRLSPYRPDPNSPIGHMLTNKTLVHIEDITAEEAYIARRDPGAIATVELAGTRTVLGVPLLNKGEMIGAFFLSRQAVRPFTDKQIDLVKNFAAQAGIAIESARLLNELRQRTTDLGEALEQQTGASEVLGVISSSTGDLEPVFESLLRNATRLCKAGFGTLYLYEEGKVRLVAAHGMPAEFSKVQRSDVTEPAPGGPLDVAIKARKAVQIPDLAATEAYRQRHPRLVDAVELGGIRTVVSVPMLKDEEPIGVIAIHRREVLPFTDKQTALLTSFAAQAVIAIENARLLNELRQRTNDLTESLEQQTATSEVLQVISSSPGELEPVFASMLENAVRICNATFGNINRWDGEFLNLVASYNTPPAFVEARRRLGIVRFGRKDPVGRMITNKKVVHIADLAQDKDYIQRSNEGIIAAVELGGVRSMVIVPMLKDNELIGTFHLSRQEVRPFTDKQIALVTSFAAQAVIAIENARLLNELRQRTNDLTESLEQQTATSEVLQVISSSPGELDPVFATMLASATRICEAKLGNLFLREGETFRAVAWHGEQTYVENWRREPLVIKTDIPDIPLARLAETKRRVHIADLRQDTAYKAGFAPLVALVDRGGARTLLIVPMLKEHTLLGAIAIYRQEIRPFTDKQIALVENFAAQAVIAIENARLLRELRERTEEVIKLNEQLEHRVADQVGEIERMGRLRRFLPPQVADLIVASGAEKQLESHRREITALFCDLRGFTGFSESADPEDVMALLRDYHAALGEIIIKYSGTLERYAGDGVMVVFNDPVPVENPALQAVLMALEMRDAIGAMTDKWRRRGHDIGFGIGIAHGFATLGTIGFEGRFDYAAIGTVSNVASRLCDEAKPGQILISPRVLMEIEDAVAVEPVGEFALKGIRRPLAAYNVLAAKSGQAPRADRADPSTAS